MKAKTNFKRGLYSITLFPNNLTLKSMLTIALVWLSIPAPVQAQEIQYTKPTWWFGVAAGANFNFYDGSTYKLNSDFTPPATFHEAKGVGLFVAPLLEYHRPDTRLGFMLQAGYDNRKAKFDQVVTPCDCPADLKTNISYITVEPSLRFAPFKSNFYLFGGPRFAFNVNKSFNYQLGINPAYPDQAASPEVKGDLSDVRKTIISMQIGLGYDIPLSSQNSKTQFVLSPFASFHPYFGQDPRSIETLNITTIRAGVALKFGRGHLIPMPDDNTTAEPEVQFSVNAPANVPIKRRVREVFPLRNYVFFNAGSSEIPSRYKLLKKDEVRDFREDQLEMVTPINQSGRSERQMNVYYNVINILGDRMIKNPSTTITLVGSSEKGEQEGKEMAESVKLYLVNIFGINSSRITTKGQLKPDIPSYQPGGTLELELLHEGDRRVSIESSSPVLLAEFQSGPDLKSSDITALQEAPAESDVVFDVKGANEAFSVWSVQATDENGKVQSFGPYTQESVSLSRKSILGDKTEGDYKIIMTGQTKSGKSVSKETSVHIARWTPAKIENGIRYSIIFEFNESKAITIYKKYLTDVVVPKIPMNGTVIIHGHTDIIGDDDHNLKLSQARANEVKSIIEDALAKSNRTDVKFEVTGYGEDLSRSPFDNKYPEERFYNRTVIIDVFKQ
ncbi:OmpA family protein [Flavobacterium sp. CF136]|uniref:OmpA family protein n=1 Tax=Flavobacterium sp. (strain CF136) TaxID=1144313 RepID=UPI0002719717|nr:OmpA family protein [Flavobacterium sp. CF136]EJL60262.1 outer membrane protein/peptidoglycan-associated (lipo)protein [Flavobacterium sp. CF136]